MHAMGHAATTSAECHCWWQPNGITQSGFYGPLSVRVAQWWACHPGVRRRAGLSLPRYYCTYRHTPRALPWLSQAVACSRACRAVAAAAPRVPGGEFYAWLMPGVCVNHEPGADRLACMYDMNKAIPENVTEHTSCL